MRLDLDPVLVMKRIVIITLEKIKYHGGTATPIDDLVLKKLS